MYMAKENTLEVIVKTELTKCVNWSAFELSSSFLQLLKVVT